MIDYKLIHSKEKTMYSLKIYHHPLSVCSMKVRLALEEKGVAWAGRVIDIVEKQEQLDPWYLELNSQGVIPTLQYSNGSTQVVTNSVDIIQFIADLPEGRALIPQQEEKIQLMNAMVDMADNIDLQILSYARHPSMVKSEKILDARIQKSMMMGEKHPELKDCYDACAKRSEKNKTFRVSAEHVQGIENKALDALSFVEEKLQGAEFLVGEVYTLADVIWTVVLSRLDLLDYNEWINGEKFPLIADYYRRVKQRESFSLAQIQNQWWEN